MQTVTETQLLFLDNLIYLDLSEYNYKGTLSDCITKIIANIDKLTLEGPAEMTKEEWVDLLESFAYAKDENGNFKTDSNGNKIIKEENRYFLENYVIENYQPNSENEYGYSEVFRFLENKFAFIL
ncbi:MAG: hypothetical protein UH080_03915 [Ruminococcus sp.]|nr:hypothetical protein [Ruminococcus sp.]